MFNDINKVLVLAPHPDDAEFGLGGTLSKLISAGKEIYLAVFSTCEKSTPSGFHTGVIMEEFYESCAFFGLPRENIFSYDFEVREFPRLRQEILEQLIVLRNQVKPDLVFIPGSSDMHQDHATLHAEAVRCFKHTNLLGYEMPWNNFEFRSMMYVILKKEDIDQKIKALQIYRSQAHRPYSEEDFVVSLAKIRGIQINTAFAESFELIRYIQK